MTDQKEREKEIRKILARVPKALHAQIRRQAFDTERSLNDIVNEALREYMARQKQTG